MLKPHVIFLMLLWAVSSNAQVREITGLVTYNNERQSGTNIKNLSTNSQTFSDDRGAFSIRVKKGDTLIAFKVNYVRDTLMVADQEYLIINLRRIPTMLKEVIINGATISPESTYEANKKEYKDIYVKGDKSHIIAPGSFALAPVFGISVNIDKLYNALSKQGKDARKMQRTLTRDYKNSMVDKRFNPLAARITGYKGQTLLDFIKDNRPAYEMVAKSSDYDIVQYIKRKLPTGKTK
jgi:hypothetical protein